MRREPLGECLRGLRSHRSPSLVAGLPRSLGRHRCPRQVPRHTRTPPARAGNGYFHAVVLTVSSDEDLAFPNGTVETPERGGLEENASVF